MGKYKLYWIRTIKDWQGEDWDVYEERKTAAGINLYSGWLYGSNRQGGAKSFIITQELVEYIEKTKRSDAIRDLGISGSVVSKMRHMFSFQRAHTKYDYAWVLKHKEDILYNSFQELFEKYSLRQHEVNACVAILRSEFGIKRNRKRIMDYEKEQNFHNNKEKIARCQTFEQVMAVVLTSDYYVAGRFHERACKELGLPTINERMQEKAKEHQKWLSDHQDLLLSPVLSVREIAQKLQLNEKQVVHIRYSLRKKHKLPQTKCLPIMRKWTEEHRAWLVEHQDEILYESFSELQQKYGFTQYQVTAYAEYLVKAAGVIRKKATRSSQTDIVREQWYQENKHAMLQMSLKEIRQVYNVSPQIAQKAYQRICKENQLPTLVEQEKLRMQQRRQWLYDHQHILLDPDLSRAEKAVQLNMTQLQVTRNRALLQQLLGQSGDREELAAWRLQHQEILLSTDLSITEIAKQLNRSTAYIVKTRNILRKALHLPPVRNQGRKWVLEHQQDLMDLSIGQLQQKYHLSYDQVRYRRQLLKQFQQEQQIMLQSGDNPQG